MIYYQWNNATDASSIIKLPQRETILLNGHPETLLDQPACLGYSHDLFLHEYYL